MNDQPSYSTDFKVKSLEDILREMNCNLAVARARAASNPSGIDSYINNKWDREKILAGNKLLKGLEQQLRDLKKAGHHKLIELLSKDIRKITRCHRHFIALRLKDRIERPFFCRHKLCPICFPYRSYKTALQIFDILNTDIKPMYGVFTFSPKNPNLEDLDSFVKRLKKSSTKVFDYKCMELKALVDGTIRVLEVNYTHFNEFHPHLHIALHFTRSLTKDEVKRLYDILTQRFQHHMDLNESHTSLVVYESTPENFKRSATYLTKYGNAQTLSSSIPTMKKEAFAAYLRACRDFRVIDRSGCFRGVRKRVSEKNKALYKSIKIPRDSTPIKLYEFGTTTKSNDNNIDA